LLVEDEPAARGATCKYLEMLGHVVGTADNADSALEAAAASPPEVLVCDCKLAAQFDGLEVARRIQEACGATVIVVSGHPAELMHEHLAGLDVVACLRKPVSLKELAEFVAKA
jgi:DNA-binding response OmpR family regulator